MLVDVWWHLPSTNGDCAGGHNTGSYPLPAVFPIFLHLPEIQPDADADGFIFLFLGKCSSVVYHGRPVQVCDRYFCLKKKYRYLISAIAFKPCAFYRCTVSCARIQTVEFEALHARPTVVQKLTRIRSVLCSDEWF